MSQAPIISGVVLSPQDQDRFWSSVNVGGQYECWEWRGHRVRGYGQFRLSARKAVAAHRVAFTVAIADIPSGLLICHSCDNPRCCNPDHLWLGTPADNTADMMAKGRGQTNVLTADDVREMHRMSDAGDSTEAIADAFGLSAGTVCDTLAGRRWASLAPQKPVRLPLADADLRALCKRHRAGEPLDEVDAYRLGLWSMIGSVKTREEAAAILERRHETAS